MRPRRTSVPTRTPTRRVACALAVAGAVLLLLAAAAAPAPAAAAPGALLWSQVFPNTTQQDYFSDSARTPDGGVVAVGTVYVGPPHNGDGSIVKYMSDGTLQWFHSWDDGDGKADQFTDVAVDAAGNVYAAGRHDTPGAASDMLLVKYDPLGVEQWSASVDAAADNDKANDVVVPGGGDPRLIGTVYIGGAYRLCLARLDRFSGALVWLTIDAGPTSSTAGAGINGAATAGGFVYVEGQMQVAGMTWRAYTAKYKPSGDIAWRRTYRPAGAADVWGHEIALDRRGRVWTLAHIDTANDTDALLVRYSAGGRRSLVRRYGFPGKRLDFTSALSVDGAGRAFVAGTSASVTGPDSQGFLVACAPDGTRLFMKRYPKAVGRTTDFATVLADGRGGAYVAGSMTYPGPLTWRLIAHYGPSGSRIWKRAIVNANGFDEFESLSFCGRSGIAAAGAVTLAVNDRDAIVETYRK